MDNLKSYLYLNAKMCTKNTNKWARGSIFVTISWCEEAKLG